jgi:hypothetical protein
MMKKAFAAMALAGMAMSAQATVVINEGFENVPGLASQGWVFTNASTPGGLTPGWSQGDQNIFNAQSGSAYSYAQANYNAAAAGGNLNAWMLTSAFDATKGATVTFSLRADALEGYFDQVNFGFVNANGTLTGLALTSVNPVPTGDWVQYTAWVGADTLSASTRFAFQYTGAADTANFVGVDSLVVDVPEPASMMLIAGGLLGLGAARRRSRA